MLLNNWSSSFSLLKLRVFIFQMMKRKQREMQENGGSPGSPGLVVSRSLADNVTNTTREDAYWCMLMSCFVKWRTTVAITCLRATVRRKRRKLQKRKKKMNPQGRSLLSMWVPWGESQTNEFIQSGHLTFGVTPISQAAYVMSFPSWRTTPGPPARGRLWRTWRKRKRK